MFQTLKQLSFLLLLLSLVFTSCKKDELLDQSLQPDKVQPKEKNINGMMNRASLRSDGLELACLVVKYPFTLVSLEDGKTYSISSESEFQQFLNDHPLTAFDFQYPLDITNSDGNDVTVKDTDELAEQFAACVPDTGWGNDCPDWFFPAWVLNLNDNCYELTYPLTLKGLDSTQVTVQDEAEFIALLSDGKPYSFTFPLKLKDAQGDVITVDDYDALFNLLSACNNHGGGVFTTFCYETVYPVSLKLADGSTATANDEDELQSLLFSGNVTGYAYPLKLKDDQGNVITVNNDQELIDALEDCSGGTVLPDTDFFCYNFEYPIKVTNALNGDVEVIADSNAWRQYFVQNAGAVEINVFPYTLIHAKDGTQVTVNSELDLMQALEDCF